MPCVQSVKHERLTSSGTTDKAQHELSHLASWMHDTMGGPLQSWRHNQISVYVHTANAKLLLPKHLAPVVCCSFSTCTDWQSLSE